MARRTQTGHSPRDTGRNRVNLVLESTTGSTDLAALSVVQLAKDLHYTEEQCHDIELAVREVVANAVLHGNRQDPNKRIFLTAAADPSGLVIYVRDEGQGFDPSSVPDPLQAEGLAQESGRGLLLIKASIDEAVWRRTLEGGTEVILTKHPARPRPAPARNGQKRDPAST
jgi:serine/threonine-protein kinase RsbW